MSPEESVRSRLLSLPAVTDLVDTRVYMLTLPQLPDLPAIRVQLLPSERSYPHLRGGGGMTKSMVQVAVTASEKSSTDPFADANAVGAAVHGDESGSALDGFTGVVEGIRILACKRRRRFQMYEADERREVSCIQDYEVDWKYA